MSIFTLLLLPLAGLGVVMIPLIRAILRQKSGKPVNRRRTLVANGATFVGVMVTFAVGCVLGVSAEASTVAATAIDTGFSDGMRYLSAALAVGLGSIGTGVAVGSAAPAAIGATSEDDKNFTKSIIFVALGEGIAIYGLLVSLLLLFAV